jgi:hypothetical protein
MRIKKQQLWTHKIKKSLQLEIISKNEKKWDVKLSGPKNFHLLETMSSDYIKNNFDAIKEKKDVSN